MAGGADARECIWRAPAACMMAVVLAAGGLLWAAIFYGCAEEDGVGAAGRDDEAASAGVNSPQKI